MYACEELNVQDAVFSIVREPRKKRMLLVGAEVRVRVSEVEDKSPILGTRDIIRWQICVT